MDGFIKALRNYMSPQLSGMDLQSPVPEPENLSNPALLHYYANEDPAMPHQSQPTPPQAPSMLMGFANPFLAPRQQAQASDTTPDQLASKIHNGFTKWGGAGVPAATLSASFARAGNGLPDPLMPAVLALKETGGGKHLADANNFLNIQYGGINHSPYEKPEYSIEGGGGHGGFPKVINSGMYKDYLKSGDLKDFFKVYTPHTDHSGKVINGSYDDQINAYNALRKNFEP